MCMDRMDKEDLLLQKRVQELAERSFSQNIYTFTEFLTVSQIDVCLSLEKELSYTGISFFGGAEDCERKVMRFGEETRLGYEEKFPIACLKIEPLSEKYADLLSHRDYLGALMNLGIDRQNLGDIFIREKTAWLFCLERIAPYLEQELVQVRKNRVRSYQVETPANLLVRQKKEVLVLVSSQRLDGVVAKLYRFSRSNSLEMIKAKKIFVNSRICENNSYLLKVKDVVSVRGYGKFCFDGIVQQTKKGNLSVRLQVYL